MTKDELLELLRSMAPNAEIRRDCERDHGVADDALLAYINDPEVTEAFNNIEKWYA